MEQLPAETLINDIPQQLARNAFYNSTFNPEKQGEHWRASYAQAVVSFLDTLLSKCKVPAQVEYCETAIARYRAGLAKRYIAFLSSQSRCASSVITGGSNFPVRQQQKRHDTAHNRQGEIYAYEEKAQAAILRDLRKLSPDYEAPKPRGLAPHPDAVTSEQEINGVRVVDSVEDNRIQIFYPGKPERETIEKLKKSGFRWTPSKGCWQAYRTAKWKLEGLLGAA